ncbi:MAG: AgmX/PglI C-terminal domain-containing protein [Deltaproteobacteria bacterium]|nr:AgmX/PglI C-terminal domain-containing protein [Deltaproteobacteria bacterium]
MEKYALDVVMSWGTSPLASELWTEPRALTLGYGPTATFAMPEESPEVGFELIVPDELGGYALRIPAGASACMFESREGVDVEVDLGAIASDAQGVRVVPLSVDARAELRIGEFIFCVRGTTPPERAAKGGVADWTAARYIGASFLFHAVMLVLMTFSPPAASALNINMDTQRARYIRASMDALAIEQQDPLFDEAAAGAPSSEGQPMEGDEGATGAEDETRHTGGGVAVRGDDEEQRVPLDRESVRSAGVLGALASALAGMPTDISSPYGAANAAGFSQESLYGPLTADAAGFGPGAGGFGMLGRGRGGCPAGRTDCLVGTVGVGTLGTVGTIGATCTSAEFHTLERTLGHAQALARCSGPGGHYGTVASHLRIGNHHTPRAIGGHATTRGGLSREQVRRVVHRNLSQVRFCYEQALQQRPDLEGRVAVRFIIRGDGAVQTSMVQNTTLRSSRVEQCVSGAVQRWSFPQTGELTIVTYPFRFQSQG